MKKSLLKKTCIAMAAVCTLSASMLAGSAHGETAETSSAKANELVYGVGSVSKTYAAAVAMQLADKGLIDIDSPVTDYIPEFEMADPRYKDITVRMLMNHSSGIMGSSTINMMLVEDNDHEAMDVFLESLKDQRLKAAPGAFTAYSNDGFTLLQLVVERVSGMDFTDYVVKNIAAPLGLTQTGSCSTMLGNTDLVKVYDKYGSPYAREYCTQIATGGICASAYDVAAFGGAFFKGNNVLLSEKAKDEMAKAATEDKYEGTFGLGWDDVDLYADKGIKVITKGGDIYLQHASLVVAPEENISVSVLSIGGNSGINTLVAEALLDIVLEEKGVDVKVAEKSDITVADKIPEEYGVYEGVYFTGTEFWNITMHDMEYIQLDKIENDSKTTEYYKYSADGKFVKMLGDVPNGGGSPDRDRTMISFVDRPDGTFIAMESVTNVERIGAMPSSTYVAQRYVPVNASDSAKAAWAARQGKYYLVDGKYSNGYFLAGMASLDVSFSVADDSCIDLDGRILAIRDEKNVQAFTTIPSTTSRDLKDYTVITSEGMEMIYDPIFDARYMPESAIPKLSTDMTSVKFSGREVKWYSFGEDLGASSITIDKTSKATVCIYDKYDNCIFDTYKSTAGSEIPLPSEGKIVFLGEGGETINVTYNT